jgi:hypothetical protein
VPPPLDQIEDPAKLRRLVQSMLMIEGELNLPIVLRHLVGEACSLVDARYGALGVLNENGTTLEQFLTVGLEPDEEFAIGPRPSGRGVLGTLIIEAKPLRLSNLSQHPDSYGFPRVRSTATFISPRKRAQPSSPPRTRPPRSRWPWRLASPSRTPGSTAWRGTTH